MASNLKTGSGGFGDFDTYFMPTYELIDANIGGEVYAWGYGPNGYLGTNSSISRSTPTQVFSSSYWKSVATSGTAGFALSHTGDLYVLGGYNQNGNFGLNLPSPLTYQSAPTQINGATNNIWTSINSTRALKADGTVWAWGDWNYAGALGQNNVVEYSSPVQILHPTGSKWSKLGLETRSGETTMLIDEYGYLWACGLNSVGQLGDNTIINRSTPVQIGTATWRQVSTNASTATGIKTDGTLWSWGYNADGCLGLNIGFSSLPYVSTPTQIGTENTWKQVVSVARSSYAIKNDGTLWSWGINDYGQLGINSTYTTKSSPVQIGTGADWKYVSAGSDFPTANPVAAIKTDGTLWTWGYNSHGALGDNTSFANKSSPTQITLPNAKWRTVSVTDSNMLAVTAGEGPAGNSTYHVGDTQSSAACYSAQGGFSLDIVNGKAIMYFGVWPTDPPNCQTCYGSWLAFAGLGVDRTGANANSNNYRASTDTRPYWTRTGSIDLSAIPVGTTSYYQIPYWPYTLVGYTYAVTKTTNNSISIQTYPSAWGTGDTGTSVSVYNWFDRVNVLWGGYNAGKAGYVLGTGTFTW